MSTPKVHLEVGLFGKAACGKTNVDVTKEPAQVTCKMCRKTAAYQEWWAEEAGLVGEP